MPANITFTNVTAKFRGLIVVPIITKFNSYAYKNANWVFAQGIPWPAAAFGYSSLSTNSDTGGKLDAFTLAGIAQNFWGDTTQLGGPIAPLPSWINNRILGWASYKEGSSHLLSSFSYNGSVLAPAAHVYFPTEISPSLAGFNPGITPGFFYGNAAMLTSLGAGITYADPGLNVNGLFYDGKNSVHKTICTTSGGAAGESLHGCAINGGNNYFVYGNTGANASGIVICDSNMSAVGGVFPTWDIAAVNNNLSKTSSNGPFSSSQVCSRGFLTYVKDNLTVAGVTLTQYLVLTSFDGLSYIIIGLQPVDVAASTALASGSFKSGQLTPDGLLWFQSSSIPDHIFTSLGAAEFANLLPISYPIPLPLVPPNPNPYIGNP